MKRRFSIESSLFKKTIALISVSHLAKPATQTKQSYIYYITFVKIKARRIFLPMLNGPDNGKYHKKLCLGNQNKSPQWEFKICSTLQNQWDNLTKYLNIVLVYKHGLTNKEI